MTRLLTVLLALAVVAVAQGQVGRPPAKKKGPNPGPAPVAPAKKPSASSSADFKPAELAKLAVIVTPNEKRGGFGGGTQSKQEQRLVEDAFLECLIAKGYTLAARSDVDSVLREKKFQDSGATEELASSVGKILNVPAVLLVRVTDLKTESAGKAGMTTRASIGARLIGVETGAILWTGNHTITTPVAGRGGAGAVLSVTSVALAEAFPMKPGASPAPEVTPKAIPKLAVITVGMSRTGFGAKRGETQSDQDRQVEDVFVQVLIDKGYRLVSRTDLNAVMKEAAFQKSGLTEDNAVAAGKLLKVPAVLLVGVNEASSDRAGAGTKSTTVGRAAVGARLVDVATGRVLWTHSQFKTVPLTAKGDIADVLADVAKGVASHMPPEPDGAAELFERGLLSEMMGQVSAAKRSYKGAVGRDAASPEGKKAAERLKLLGG